MPPQIDITQAGATAGYMSTIELRWLAAHAQACSTIIEIGSWKGRSTRALGDHVRQPGGVVYAVDHWQGQLRDPAAAPTRELAARGRDTILAEFKANVGDLIGRGVVKPIELMAIEAAPVLLQQLGPASVDMVFIDGDHSALGMNEDLDGYLPLLKPGGMLCGHDYNNQIRHRGVREVVDRRYPGRALHATIWWVRV
jgi:predicted O-methyltransferase YrrM